MRGKLVRGAVAREESDGDVVVREDVDGCGCGAPRGSWVDGCDGRVAWELLETGSADYGDVDDAWEREVRIVFGEGEDGSMEGGPGRLGITFVCCG